MQDNLLAENSGFMDDTNLLNLDSLTQSQLIQVIVRNQRAHHADLVRINKGLAQVSQKLSEFSIEIHGTNTNPGIAKEIVNHNSQVKDLQLAIDNIQNQLEDIHRAILGDGKYDTPGILTRIKSLEKFKGKLQKYILIATGATAVISYLLTYIVKFIIRYLSA